MGRVYPGLNLTAIIFGMSNTRSHYNSLTSMWRKKIHFGYMNKSCMSAKLSRKVIITM